MRNPYQKLTETIHVPAGLNDRVLFAARRQMDFEERHQRRRIPLFRTAVCAACALALVLGSVHLRTVGGGAEAPDGSAPPAVTGETRPEPVLSFGLTAYAASTGTSYGCSDEDGGIGFAVGEGMANPGEGSFTGCLFQVTGEEIAAVALSIDRGGLYRYQLQENLSEKQMNAYRQAMAEGTVATAAISQRDDGTWYMPEMTPLGSEVQETYDPAASYGFWVAPEDMAYHTGLDLSAEAQLDADFFEGAALTVTVTFADGGERTQVYRLHSGNLKVEFGEDNAIAVLPELAGPDDPFVYGIYALTEE